MKVLMINVVCGIRSTGRICTDLAAALEAQGHEVRIAYGRMNVPEQFQRYAHRIGSEADVAAHAVRTRLTDGCGFGSRHATERFVEWIRQYDPDVIHLHNIHGYYLNIDVLFSYLRSCGKRIIWTLHDCWAFTGHAAFCEAADCEKWRTGCSRCPKKSDYPKSITDRSERNWARKKQLFTGIANLELVTPSFWLAGLIRQSFLSEYPVSVIHNGIDTAVFRQTASNVKQRLGIADKKMVLGVAALWEPRKGLDDFLALAGILDEDYRVVLVGLSRKQLETLPPTVIGIERTDSVKELAELYSAADVFVNPTYEDNYPTTNLEAIACGTPVLSYDTGGSGESAALYGDVVKKGELHLLAERIQGSLSFTRDASSLDASEEIAAYVRLYGAENEGGGPKKDCI